MQNKGKNQYKCVNYSYSTPNKFRSIAINDENLTEERWLLKKIHQNWLFLSLNPNLDKCRDFLNLKRYSEPALQLVEEIAQVLFLEKLREIHVTSRKKIPCFFLKLINFEAFMQK